MPDVTISFTDAQWVRIVAASSYIKRIDEAGDVDAEWLANRWKNQVAAWVKEYEKQQASIDDF